MADKKKRTFRPERQTLNLNERLLPELKNLDVGKEAIITLKVKVIGKQEGEQWAGDDDWYEEEYGKEYADKKRAEKKLMRGTFEILDADEDNDGLGSTPEAAAARKIMADKKKGRQI